MTVFRGFLELLFDVQGFSRICDKELDLNEATGSKRSQESHLQLFDQPEELKGQLLRD